MRNALHIRLDSGHTIGTGHPCFIVAELGNNHQGDVRVARDMLHAAADAGVQAVKFQKRYTEALFTRAGREAPYTGKNSFGPTYGEHRDALELSIQEMAELKELAESLGLVFFASAWDGFSLRQMLDLGMELIKICSADLVNVPMLRQAGQTGKPVILSTGMSTWEQIDAAVAELRAFHSRVVLLHCNSSYPCPEENIGLPAMARIALRYGLPVGYSGHERGLAPSVAAASLGACVVERHFTLDKTMRGTDHQASLEPAEFAQLVSMIREVEKSMAISDKHLFPTEAESAKKLRKSIFFTRDLPAGHVVTEADVTVKCPGTGLSPLYWDDVLGARLTRSVRCEETVDWAALAPATSGARQEVLP